MQALNNIHTYYKTAPLMLKICFVNAEFLL